MNVHAQSHTQTFTKLCMLRNAKLASDPCRPGSPISYLNCFIFRVFHVVEEGCKVSFLQEKDPHLLIFCLVSSIIQPFSTPKVLLDSVLSSAA